MKLSMDQVFGYLNATKLFNLKTLGDILVDFNPPKKEKNPFNTDQMRRYIKFITIEGGLNGLF